LLDALLVPASRLVEVRCALVPVRKGDEGRDACILDGHDVLDGAIGGVARDLMRRECQRKQVRQKRPSITWFFITSEGVANTLRMMRALSSTTALMLVPFSSREKSGRIGNCNFPYSAPSDAQKQPDHKHKDTNYDDQYHEFRKMVT